MQKCDNHDEIHRSQVFKLYYSYQSWENSMFVLILLKCRCNPPEWGCSWHSCWCVWSGRGPAGSRRTTERPPPARYARPGSVQKPRKHISTFLRQTLTAVCRRIIMLTACCSHKRDIFSAKRKPTVFGTVWTIRWESILALARKPVACKQIHNFLMQTCISWKQCFLWIHLNSKTFDDAKRFRTACQSPAWERSRFKGTE